jgi:hypothetical protein
VPTQGLSGAATLEIDAGFLADEWGNRNPAISVPIQLGQPLGTVLFAGAAPGSTAAASTARTTTSVAFGFHGQYYDEDTGLLYCRARYYDPYTGPDAKVRVAVEHGGKVVYRELTGDLDIYYVKVDGRTLSAKEVMALKIPMNQEIGKAYRRQGGKGMIGSSVHHGAHVNLPEMHGEIINHYGSVLGRKWGDVGDVHAYGPSDLNPLQVEKYGDKHLDIIDGPGAEAFAVRLEANGRVKAYKPDISMLRQELDASASGFYQKTGRSVHDVKGFDWYKGFPK